MEWNVFYYNINKGCIECLNIFEHTNFKYEVDDLIKKCNDKVEMAKKLERLLYYYYRYKAEYEVIIKPWIGDDRVIGKIDVYSQIMINWPAFFDYVCRNARINIGACDIEDKNITDVIKYDIPKITPFGTVWQHNNM